MKITCECCTDIPDENITYRNFDVDEGGGYSVEAYEIKAKCDTCDKGFEVEDWGSINSISDAKEVLENIMFNRIKQVAHYYISMFKTIERNVNSKRFTDTEKVNIISSIFKDIHFTESCRKNQSYEQSQSGRSVGDSISVGGSGPTITVPAWMRFDWPNPTFEEYSKKFEKK